MNFKFKIKNCVILLEKEKNRVSCLTGLRFSNMAMSQLNVSLN